MGRDVHCEIHLDDTETSRIHAEICFVDGNYILRDLDSSNGTFVNGTRIAEHQLLQGDRIQIGRQLMLFKLTIQPATREEGVDIVNSSNSDSSQIVGRVGLERQLLEETDDWTSYIRSESVAQAKSHWEIMYRTSLAVSRTLDIDQLLHQILELIFQWVQCDRGCIMLTDQESGELHPKARRNRNSRGSSNRITISRTILDYVCKKEEGVLTNDACEDDRWNGSASISSSGIREAICVPMKGRYGNVGVIYIDTSVSAGRFAHESSRIFTEEHLKMLVAIGHQAALAIEDTNYYQSLVHAERLAVMGQTIATLSHHIKNIVQGLKGGGYLVNQAIQNQDWNVVGKGWGICNRNHERIETLVMDMLTMSKDRRPNLVLTDLRSIITEVVDLSNTRAAEKSVSLSWLAPESPIELPVESEAIHRAILNLVCNAIDACVDKPEAHVDIQLESNSERILIRVQDNGVGIAVDDLGRIFSMFESSKGSRGTGLGLPVSLKIAKEHGGTIEVRSEIGSGTVFEFILPRISCTNSLPSDVSPTVPG
jgi:signal transduction histidine kinase